MEEVNGCVLLTSPAGKKREMSEAIFHKDVIKAEFRMYTLSLLSQQRLSSSDANKGEETEESLLLFSFFN